jgi:hypothetical protein
MIDTRPEPRPDREAAPTAQLGAAGSIPIP